MGLASALSTSLTGLNTAETTIDVVGNNLANSNTIGFKASSAIFATQFLQTQSLGSKPTDSNAGTNPRQIGLGALVAGITPDFTPGTIEISTNPMNMAIQEDGFFIVQGDGGEHLYTRNGIFSLNSANQLTTATGNRILGFGVDSDYNIDAKQLVPLTINLGGDVVAEATENVYLEGRLPPDNTKVATDSQIIESATLGNGTYTRPVWQQTAGGDPIEPHAAEAPTPSIPNNITLSTEAGNLADATTYYYRITYANFDATSPDPLIEWVDGSTAIPESLASGIPTDPLEISFTTTAAGQACDIPLGAPANGYDYFRIYRSTDPTGTFEYLGQSTGGVYTDGAAATSEIPLQPQTTDLRDNYSYYVTFTHATQAGIESRPSTPIAANVSMDGRVLLNDIPIPEGEPWIDADGKYEMKIYRNTKNEQNVWYEVATLSNCDIADPPSFTDRLSDDAITNHGTPLNFDGPVATPTTRLVDLIRQTGTESALQYEKMFDIPVGSTATLEFSPKKGGVLLNIKELVINHNTTIQDLTTFMQDACGIVSPKPGEEHPVPVDAETGAAPSVAIMNGQIRVVSNTGQQNAIDIDLSSMLLEISGTSGASNVSIPFGLLQSANGIGTMTDFLAYDSLGIPVQVRLTFELESVDSAKTTYRWYADSPDNQTSSGSAELNCGTGLIYFDGKGNLMSVTESTVAINRKHVPAVSPLEFDLDFSGMKALDEKNAWASVSSQDGSAPGTLTSFIVGEDGVIRGVYSNGVTRDLGQIRLARFANPSGLQQKGENLFTTGVNSGEPIEGNPGEQGIGSIIAGAVELSNTDIGANLIDLILASTMYRGNSRVITTTQEMFDELLNLHR